MTQLFGINKDKLQVITPNKLNINLISFLACLEPIEHVECKCKKKEERCTKCNGRRREFRTILSCSHCKGTGKEPREEGNKPWWELNAQDTNVFTYTPEEIKERASSMFDGYFNQDGDDSKMPGGTSADIKKLMYKAIDDATFQEKRRWEDVVKAWTVPGKASWFHQEDMKDILKKQWRTLYDALTKAIEL